MKITDDKMEANRRNGKKSRGPKDTSSTRFNATKHGLLANGLTELDDAEGFRETFRDLKGGDTQVLNNFIYECRSESTRLNSSHTVISYAVFCLKKKRKHGTM